MSALEVRTWLIQTAKEPVLRAFGLSLAVHLLLFGTVELGAYLHVWDVSFLKPRMKKAEELPPVNLPTEQQLRSALEDTPLSFVEVDPATATPEPPRDAKFYSAQNSKAANPFPADANIPKIDGTQDKVPKTVTVKKREEFPLQPALPLPEPPKAVTQPPTTEQGKAPPKRTADAGESIQAKPEVKPEARDDGSDKGAPQIAAEPPRPKLRTLAQARQQRGMIEGERLKQDGGVKRVSLEASFDVKATPFGAYDAAFIAAISKRWHDLIDERTPQHHSGKVVVHFRLHRDGRVSELKVQENTVTEFLAFLCQRAVEDPAPYAPWPSDMQRMIGKDFREITFTFYYL